MNQILIAEFEKIVNTFPDKIAIEEEGQQVSYQVLNERCNRLAWAMDAIGVTHDAIVSVIIPSSVNLVTSLLAVLKAGGIYLPVDLAFTERRIAQIFGQTECQFILTTTALKEEVCALISKLALQVSYVLVLDEKGALCECLNYGPATVFPDSNISNKNPDARILPEDSCYIFYTSGSTGEAKAFLGMHKSLHHFIAWERKEFNIDHNIRVSQLTQTTFDASLRDIFVPLTSGGTLCIPPAGYRSNIVKLVEWIEAAQVHLIHCVPSLFRLLIKEISAAATQRTYFPALKQVLMAGEILYGRDVQNWQKAAGDHTEIVNLYGTSETTLAKTFHRVKGVPEDPAQALHVGKPIEGAFIAIINSAGKLCRIGEIGEIYIKTPFMTKGYFKNEALTNKVFVQNPLLTEKDIIYKTGDLGRYLADRSVEVLGRLDDQVKINGIRVELAEIKQAVLAKEGVNEAFITTHKNRDSQLELICYYIGNGISTAALRASLQTNLNENLIPSYFIAMEEFPLTLNGKVDKKALPLPDNMVISDEDYEAPEGAVESTLEAIYREVLGLKRVGRKVSFFSIGGTSLKAMQVISRIYKALDISLKIADIFSNPTVAKLAVVVAAGRQKAYESITPLPLQEDYALSHAQQRLWVLYKLEQEQVAYNMSAAVELNGALNRSAFAATLDTLVERHESLRTIFVTVEGSPRQRILSPAEVGFVLQYEDLQQLPEGEEGLQQRIRQDIATPFDLARGPLFRASLLQADVDRYVFVYTLHHIISDGWSMEVLISELITLYNAYSKQTDNPLAPLAIQYKDYAAWQQNLQDNGEMEAARKYWLEQFADTPPVLELPADAFRPARKTYAGDHIRFTLSAQLTSELKALADKHEASLYMVLLSAVYTLLYRYTGQPDIVLGTPVSGREREELENQIGFFVNTLALRTTIGITDDFSTLLQKVKETTVNAYTHQYYPFDLLVDELALERDLSRHPLFDVMVALQNISLSTISAKAVAGIAVTPIAADAPASKFDLLFNFSEHEEQLHGFVQYNTDLFAPERIERLIGHLQALIAALTQAPHLALDKLEYLSATEKEQLLVDFNDTEVLYPHDQTLTDLFEAQALAQPDKAAILFEDRSLTYRQLNEKANQLAHYLAAHYQLQANDLVALMMERSEWMTVAIMAVLKAGAAYVPVDPAYPEDRKQYILQDTQAKALITDELIASLLPELDSWDSSNPGKCIDVQQLAYIIYTSGSTGQPKGAILAHQGVVNRIHWMKNQYDFTTADVVLQKTPYVFDVSVWEFFMPLCYGGTLVACSKDVIYDPALLIDMIEQRGITHIHFVPGMFGVFLQALDAEKAARLHSLKHIHCSGEALKPEHVRQHHALLHCQLNNLYGPTEASVDVSYYTTNAGDTIVPIGKPIDNIQLYVLDKQLHLQPIGIPGELYIGGVGLAKGYLNKPALTAERFIDHPFWPGEKLYKTGDVARWLPDGNIEYLGRSDFQVKIRGFRIEPGEIENVIKQYQGVGEVLVLPREDANGDKYLAAYFTAGENLDLSQLRSFIRGRLPEYMMPAYFITLDVFPVNANGKIDRKALPDPVQSLPAAGGYVAPRNEMESALAAIWEEVLGRGRVGVTDHFFEIGGNSLNATKVVFRIARGMGLDVPLKSLFEHPTVETLAIAIADISEQQQDALVALASQPHYALSHGQKRLWVLDQFEENQVSYIIPEVYILKGDLNRDAFEQAFMSLVARHEILRTTFAQVDGEPRQFVHAAAAYPFGIEFIDRRGMSRQDALEYAHTAARISFDLQHGPLLKARLIQFDEQQYVFLFVMHHIIFDGWSIAVMLEEIMALYKAYAAAKAPTLAALDIQYKDYAAWENKQLEGPKADQARSYWHTQLNGTLPVLNLPLDYPRPPFLTSNGNVQKKTIEPALYKAVKELGQQHGASLFITLMTAVKALLYRYTGQEDIIIGFPVAGRDHHQLEHQIGFYVNTLVVRTQMDGTAAFDALLKQVREHTVAAYEYQHYPFDKLVGELELPRDLSRSPLFDVMVSLEQAIRRVAAVQEETGLELETHTANVSISKLDLSFDFYDNGESLVLCLEYNTDLFRPERIASMLEHYVCLLQSVTANSAVSLDRVTLLGEGEQHRLLHTFNDTAAEMPAQQSILELFEEQVALRPDAAAVIYGNTVLTYEELNDAANQLAHYLLARYHVQPDDRIGIMVQRSEKMLVYLLGILKAGAAYVPVDPAYPQERVRYMIGDSGMKILLTDQQLDPAIQSLTALVINPALEEDEIRIYKTATPELNITRDQLAYVIYTSGSTGQPKGVMVEHGSLLNIALGWRTDYRLDTFEVHLLQMASISFDVFCGDVCRALLNGGSMVIVPSGVHMDTAALYRLMQTHAINIFESTPSLVVPLMDHIYEQQLDITFMKLLILGSDVCRVSDFRRLQERFGGQLRIINSYGTTETAIDASFYEAPLAALPAAGHVPVGKPMRNTRYYVLDRNRQLLPIGITGELYIGGAGVARGYLDRPALTAERFISNPFASGERMYKTGDMASWLVDGNLLFAGRNDLQVKLRGYRIEPGEIETALRQHPAITQVVVTLKGTTADGQLLVAYYTADEELAAEELREWLNARLPHYMVPDVLMYLEALPLTVNGKIDYKALPDVTALDNTATYIAARTRLEAQLVEIWEEVLGRSGIGIKDNFFEIGGHSLKATRMLAQLHKNLQLRTDLRTIFSYPTIESLAGAISALPGNRYSAIEPVAKKAYYDVSHAQKRLWILDQLEEEQVAYNIPAAFELSGILDLAAFSKALETLVARHESLRTIFREVEGEPKQMIQDITSIDFALQYEDLRKVADREALAAQVAAEEAVQPFVLAEGPLLRARLLQLEDERYIFLFTTHHIISDGWSMVVMVRELIGLYQSFKHGASHPLAPLGIQYKDYAAWQQEQLSGDHVSAHQSWWLEQFSGDIPVLELYPDYPRPAAKSYNGDTYTFKLDASMQTGLNELGTQQGASLFMTLLAAVKVLLYRYSGQTDIVIGSPVAGRDHSDLEQQVGFYVNTLPLRTQFSAADDFIGLLQKVKDTTLGAYDHQVYPFDRLVDELDLDRDLSRSPLFDVMVTLQHADADDISALEGLSVKTHAVGTGVSKFDLTYNFNVLETGQLLVEIEYNTDLFSTARIERMGVHLQGLLRAVLNNATVPLSKLEYLGTEEQQLLLHGFSDTALALPDAKHTLVSLFNEQVQRKPDAIAVQVDGQSLTYRELDEQSNQLAHYLQRKGVYVETLVPICIERSLQMIVGILGTLKAGGAYVPIGPDYPAARIAYMLEDTGASLILSSSKYSAALKEITTIDIIALDEDELLISACSKAAPLYVPAPDHLAYVIYTSGSTGQPKGVMVEHRNVTALVMGMGERLGLQPGLQLAATTNYTFDISVLEFLGALVIGASLYLVTDNDPVHILQLVAARTIHALQCTPSRLNQLLELGGVEALRPLQLLLIGGEAMSSSLYNKLRQLMGTRVINAYGPTETTIWSTALDIHESKGLSVGTPLPNEQVYIIDKDQQLVPVGVAGEICIAGTGVTRGYLHKPELSAQKFLQHPFSNDPAARLYRTGDLGRWQPDGTIAYIGRMDEQVKIRGYRIEPGEIEKTLLLHPAVNDAAVLVKKGRDEQPYLAAYFTATDTVDVAALREHLGKALPAYMIPEAFVKMEIMPLNASGKLDRKALPEPAHAARGKATTYVPARTRLEAQLVALWEEVLGRSGIGVRDNFFEIGGHSLKATRILSLMHKTLQLRTDLRTIFSNPTIEALAAAVSALSGKRYSAIEPVAEQEYYDLSHAQKRLWILDQLEAEQSAYNIPAAYELSGVLNLAAFSKALETLVARHESLRTVFRDVEGEPKQLIQDIAACGFALQYEDLRKLADKTTMAAQRAAQEAVQPFSLAAGPLLRARLLQLEDEHYVFLFTTHHIISDGWSMVVMMRELIGLYQSYSRGVSHELAPLRIQYKDYGAWQQEQLSGDHVLAHQSWWLEKFSGTIPLLELYPDYARPAVKTYDGNTYTFKLDESLHTGLNELGMQQGASLFMALQAAVKALLYRYSGQTDIVIGSPVAGRDHNDLEQQVGFYVNTLPLRTQFAATDDFIALLQKVKDNTLGAYDHQVYPFDRLVDDLDLDRDLSRSPLFDVMVTLQHADAEEIGNTPEGLSVKGYSVESGVSKFDLSWHFIVLPSGLQVAIEYNTNLFTAARIERMGAHLQGLLQSVLQDAATPLNRLEYLDKHEKQEIVYDFNNTIVPYDKQQTMHGLFEERVALLPTHTALRQHGREMSYESLNHKANRLAHYLIANGVQNGDNVGLTAGRNFNMIIGLMAILKAGAAYVPIDPVYPIDRQLYIMQNSGVALVLIDEKYPVTAADEQIRFISLSDETIGGYSHSNPGIKKNSADLAYTIYTSGSTGRPKGVMIAHHAAVNLIAWVNKTYSIHENDRMLFITSMCFDLSVYDIFGILAAGGTVVIAEQEEVTDVERLQRLMLEERITFWDAVPTTMHYLVNEIEESGLPYQQQDLKVVFMSGDWIPVALPQKIRRYFPQAQVISLGGATEGTVWSNYYPILQDMSGRVSVPYGKPIDNNFFYILDEHLNPVPKGVAGELYIGGAGVAEGYANDPEKTAASFVADPFNQELGARMYRTGDLGRMLEDGNMEFMGRKDHQVKIRGFRIELGEIKNVLLQHPEIREAVVIAEEDQSYNKYLLAYLVGNEQLDTGSLKAYLSRHLPDYMVPASFIILEALPLSSNGKIDMKALPRPEQGALSTGNAYTAPRNETETALVAIWEEVLGKAPIGVYDHFFETGGHSLNATRIISRIARHMQVKLELRSIFQHPTIAALTAVIQQTASDVQESITAVTIQEHYEVSHAQKRLWLLEQYEAGTAAYHIPRALKIQGQLDTAALERAFESLLQRHESLRTVFVPVQGIPRQKVLDSSAGFKIAFADLRQEQDKDALLNSLIMETVSRPFDLANDLLLRVALFRLDEQEHVFVMNMHHIIADGWSLDVLTKECLAFYHYHADGTPHDLAPLKVQYKDYSAWHNALLKAPEAVQHQQYWKERFAGSVPVLQFPTDHPRPAIKTYHGNELSFELQEALSEKLHKIATRNGASLFMTLLSAVKVLLYRFSEQEDIVVGSIHAGREHGDLEDQIGFYVNTLALRTMLQADDSFLQVLDKVKASTLGAYEHQSYPFDQLVTELGLGRDKSRHPLFDIYVDLLNISAMPVRSSNADGLQLAELNIGAPVSKYDLSFRFFDAGSTITAIIEYNTDLFEPATIHLIQQAFLEIVEQATSRPHERITAALPENGETGSGKAMAGAFDFNF